MWLLSQQYSSPSLILAGDAELRIRFGSRHDDDRFGNMLSLLRDFPYFTEIGTMPAMTIVYDLFGTAQLHVFYVPLHFFGQQMQLYKLYSRKKNVKL